LLKEGGSITIDYRDNQIMLDSQVEAHETV